MTNGWEISDDIRKNVLAFHQPGEIYMIIQERIAAPSIPSKTNTLQMDDNQYFCNSSWKWASIKTTPRNDRKIINHVKANTNFTRADLSGSMWSKCKYIYDETNIE